MVLNPLIYGQNRWYFLITLIAMGSLQAFGVVYYYDMPLPPAIMDAVFSWLGIGSLLFFAANTLSYYHPSRGKGVLVIFTSLFLAYIWLWLSTVIIVGITRSQDYEGFVQHTQLYRFTVAFLVFLGTTTCSLIWYRLGEKEDEQRRKVETDKMSKEAELFKLRQQLQPHFLFNSLNSINSLIGTRQEEARTMVQQLSDFLRGTLKREDQKFISLQEELDYLNLYLDIEQVRFGHRLKVEMACADDLLMWKIPPLILQPVLENAIKFGLYGTTGNIIIDFKCEVSDNLLLLTIVNPFDPDMQPPEGTGFGLRSVKRRLYLLFARTDLLKAEALENNYTVTIKIPKLND